MACLPQLFTFHFESGRLDKGRHQGNIGNPRARYYQQRTIICNTQRFQHMDAKYTGR